MITEAFRRAELEEVAEKIEECGKDVITANCEKCGTKHFKTYSKCRQRWCFNCLNLKRLAWIAKTLQRLVDLLEEGYNLVKINYTLEDMEDIEEMLDMMKRYWRILNHDDKNLRKKFKSRLVGGLRSIEVKRGKNSGLWHIHFHTIAVTDKEFEKDYYWLMPAWKKVTKGKGSIWVKGINKEKMGLVKEIAEAVKYIVKPEESLLKNVEDLRNAYYALKGVRQVNTWGKLRKLSKEVEEESEKDEKKLTDFICQMCGCSEYKLKVYLYNNIKEEIIYNLKKEEDEKSDIEELSI